MKYVDLGNNVSQYQQKNKLEAQKKKSRLGSVFIKYLIVLVIIIGVITGFVFIGNAFGLFNPVSIVASVAKVDLKETDGRTNVLVLGSDARSNTEEQSILTDTLLVVSIGRIEGNVVLISLPRDLWVKSPAGYHSKINAVYAYGGGEEISQVAEDVLGIPIHYYAVVNFDVFKESVDVLGGIEVDVEKTFDDFYYPLEGKENAPITERYETVHFDAGRQLMGGDLALKYVRSRKGNNGEGTDFARSKRQQKVIMAIKGKVLSLETLVDISKLKNLYNTYSQNVDSNISFDDLQGFYLLSQQIDFDGIRSIVLDDRSSADSGGLLYAPTDNSLYGGAYVLLSRDGDFSQLHAYVQRYIFGE